MAYNSLLLGTSPEVPMPNSIHMWNVSVSLGGMKYKLNKAQHRGLPERKF